MSPMLPPKACATCGKPFSGVCQNCTSTKREYASRKDDPTRKLYDRAVWQRFRVMALSANPLCQALERDWHANAPTQCRQAASEIHHLQSPRDYPDLMLEPSNVVALCRNHHHKAPGEESGRREPDKYTPTMWQSNPLGGSLSAVN